MEKDEILYLRFLEGDETAFKELVLRHREALVLFIYGFVHQMEDAEDLMMETFARLLASHSPFKGKSSFKTWLFTIGRNLALMQVRKERFWNKSVDIQGTGSQMPGLDLELLQEERNRILYQGLESLHTDYRQVLFLIYFENMSYAEAGEVMKKNEKQITNLAYRGKKALKDFLEKEGFEYEGY